MGVSLVWNVLQRRIRKCWVHWGCTLFFLYSAGNVRFWKTAYTCSLLRNKMCPEKWCLTRFMKKAFTKSIGHRLWPTMFCSCTQCWQRDVTWLSCLHKQRGARKGNEVGVWVQKTCGYTQHYKCQDWKSKTCLLHSWTLLSLHELADLDSQHASIQSTSGILTNSCTPHHNSSTNYSTIVISTILNTVRTQTVWSGGVLLWPEGAYFLITRLLAKGKR